MKIFKFILIFLFLFNFKVNALEKCKWNNIRGIPCVTINKTSNTSDISSKGINKTIITKEEMLKKGVVDVKGVLDLIPGLDLKQNGQKGQLTSLFMRGTNSNHTLVLLNGIAINDQSTTQGLHNFGQDFIQTIQQIEIYKGASGAHFGPSAIGGAINFITDIDYQNSYSVNGFNSKNNSIDGNYSKILDNGWHINLKGSHTKSKTGSARYNGKESDGAKNKQINLNLTKWFNDNLKFKTTAYTRVTKADYDGSSTDEYNYISDDKMYLFQTSLDYKKNKKENSIKFHYNKYDREYNEKGSFDNFYSDSLVVKGESNFKLSNKFSYGYGSEFKYDWGKFTNKGSFYPLSQVDNEVNNLGIFMNSGYKINNNTIISGFFRADDHKTTNLSKTYKLNLNKEFKKFKFNITQSTGLRNPTLYELYGSNGRTDAFKHVPNQNAKPEKSLTNEISLDFNFNKNLYISSTAYKSSISNALLYDSNFNGGSGYTNTIEDLKQKGLETNFIIKNKNQKILLFNTISSSKKTDGSHQLNRPNITYGIDYSKIIKTEIVGNLDLNLNYKHYGKAFDYNPGISKVDSTDIISLSLSKSLLDSKISLQISNLFNEKYQRPVGYLQEGRKIRFNIRNKF